MYDGTNILCAMLFIHKFKKVTVRPMFVQCSSSVRPLFICLSFTFIEFTFGQLLRCPHKVYIEKEEHASSISTIP